MTFTIETPDLFNYDECLKYLRRSPLECLHHVEEDKIFKLIELTGDLVLFAIKPQSKGLLRVDVHGSDGEEIEEGIRSYIKSWFDLGTPLKEFYSQIEEDPILSRLAEQYSGLRMIKVPDLFEALCWSVIGQQINLTFAYQIKRDLVRNHGRVLKHEGQDYYLFPKPKDIAGISDDEFRTMKFSRQKTKYIRNVASAIDSGDINKEQLMEMSDEGRESKLTSIKGIGSWSANYVMMRCLNSRSALPAADVGVQNALKMHYGLETKPSTEETEKLFEKWEDWHSYITFYLWHSLANS